MTNTIKLQGINGEKQGTPTKDLKIGDVIIWNFGYKSEVVEILPSKTGKTITFMLKSLESGNINPRKMRSDRLVVVDEKQEEEPQNEVEKAISPIGWTKQDYIDIMSYFDCIGFMRISEEDAKEVSMLPTGNFTEFLKLEKQP